jgi:dTDP-4-amino-4,6-dideoxygalactose transaminase
MTIPLLDLDAQYHTIQPEINAAVLEVLENGKFILDSNVSALETEAEVVLALKDIFGGNR